MKLKKVKKFKFIWTHSGRIYLRKDNDSPAQLITCQDEKNYYSISSFKSGVGSRQLTPVPDSFSVLHSNVRSLSANYDTLSALLSNLNFKFSVIGLTETKISMQKSLVSNVSIDGYHFFSQPSHQNAGGVGLYVRDDCEFHIRDDFTVSTNDFECLSLEIHCQSQNNIIAAEQASLKRASERSSRPNLCE